MDWPGRCTRQSHRGCRRALIRVALWAAVGSHASAPWDTCPRSQARLEPGVYLCESLGAYSPDYFTCSVVTCRNGSGKFSTSYRFLGLLGAPRLLAPRSLGLVCR